MTPRAVTPQPYRTRTAPERSDASGHANTRTPVSVRLCPASVGSPWPTVSVAATVTPIGSTHSNEGQGWPALTLRSRVMPTLSYHLLAEPAHARL